MNKADLFVPGSNTGIGKTTAIDLAKRGARVILACRSKQRGEDALAEIKKVRRWTFFNMMNLACTHVAIQILEQSHEGYLVCRRVGATGWCSCSWIWGV